MLRTTSVQACRHPGNPTCICVPLSPHTTVAAFRIGILCCVRPVWGASPTEAGSPLPSAAGRVRTLSSCERGRQCATAKVSLGSARPTSRLTWPLPPSTFSNTECLPEHAHAPAQSRRRHAPYQKTSAFLGDSVPRRKGSGSAARQERTTATPLQYGKRPLQSLHPAPWISPLTSRESVWSNPGREESDAAPPRSTPSQPLPSPSFAGEGMLRPSRSVAGLESQEPTLW